MVIEQIRNQGGDYLIALKGNQGNLHAEAMNFFVQALLVTPEEADCDYWRIEETSHGRHEIRKVWTTDDLSWLPQKDDWLDLRSLMCLRLTRASRLRKRGTIYLI